MPQDFSGQNLRGRSFTSQDLTGANFSHADIGGADFSKAILRGANFSYAQAGLKGKDLKSTRFNEADIRSANFTEAKLRGANFSHVQAGLQRRWVIVLLVVSLFLLTLLGLVSAYAGAFTGGALIIGSALISEGLSPLFFGGVVILITLAVFSIVTIRQGIVVALVALTIGTVVAAYAAATMVRTMDAFTAAAAGAGTVTGAGVAVVVVSGAVAGVAAMTGAIVVSGAVAGPLAGDMVGAVAGVLPPLHQQQDWLGLQSVVMVVRTRQLWHKTTHEVQFHLTSLESNASKVGRAIRLHWGMENEWHWTLDVTFALRCLSSAFCSCTPKLVAVASHRAECPQP